MFFIPRKIPWKFRVDISIRSVLGRGVKKGGTWGTLRVSDQRHGGYGCSWCHEWCFLPQGRYPENFVLISHLEVCQEGGVKKCSTWKTLGVPDQRHGWQGYSWCHEWCSFTPRKVPWNIFVDISIGSVSKRGVLGVRWGFLTGDMEDGVILEAMEDLGRVQGSCPEGFVEFSLFLSEI